MVKGQDIAFWKKTFKYISMKRIIGICLLYIIFSAFSQSQTMDIKGDVKDDAGSLAGVVITITPEDDKNVIYHAVTDNEGKFFIKNVDMEKAMFICIRLMGYATQVEALNKSKTEYNFHLKEESILLSEVQIKGDKISAAGDTTNYLVSSFAKENDITLGDVLKRMPGFNVTDGGAIKYQGKDISDFYVEGSNIMGSKYPIAVSSIKHDDVGSVEAIENHQSIKLFEDLLFSDNTAINIRLKDKAKDKWVGLLNVGGGMTNQWSADVNTMRFAQKVKMLNTYKGNNTGKDVSIMSTPLFSTSNNTEEDAQEIIKMRNTINPYLDVNKTLFNKSHLLSLNNQVLLGKSFMLTPQIDLGKSSFNNTIREERNYYLPNGETTKIFTHEKGCQKQWDISPRIVLEANTPKMYFNNTLLSNIVHKQNDVSIDGTYPNIENAKTDYVNIHNTFNVMFRMGQKVIGIKSINSWRQRPQAIHIKQNDNLINQEAKTSTFNSHTFSSQSFTFGKTTLSIEEGYTFSRQKLNSTLDGVNYLSYYEPLENNMVYNNLLLYLRPSLSIRLADFRVTLSNPINFNYTKYTDNQDQKTYYRQKWLLSPKASLAWTINNKYVISTNAGWQQQDEKSDNFYSSPLLSSYPYVQSGILDFQNAENANIGALIRYKNILRGLFWNASYNILWHKKDLMLTQSFKDDYIVSGLIQNPHTTKSENIFVNISYVLDLLRGGMSLRGIYSNFDSYYIQNEIQQHSTSKMQQLSFNIYSLPVSQLDINYTFSISSNTFLLEARDKQSANTMNQKLSLTIIPTNKLNVVVTGNHYLNAFEDGDKNTFLFDADINYRLSSLWSFRLSAQNIFNQKEFSYISYTDMMSIERKYKIRPFSLLISVITSF